MPALALSLPLIVFVAGLTFAVGEATRNAVLVNMVPLVILLGCVFFLWTWSPSWLDPRWNRVLMLADPTGFRWISESWLKVDRGAEFYNTARIVFDPAFLASRITLVVVGLMAVVRSQRHLASTLRGEVVPENDVRRALAEQNELARRPVLRESPLAEMEMSARPQGVFRNTIEIARIECLVLARHPAMWILIPLVVLNATVDAIYATGSLDTPLLLTPGVSAVGSLVELTFALCLLLMFYTVESLRRERSTRLDAIAYATPVRTSALILGKAIANGVVAAATLLACLRDLRCITAPAGNGAARSVALCRGLRIPGGTDRGLRHCACRSHLFAHREPRDDLCAGHRRHDEWWNPHCPQQDELGVELVAFGRPEMERHGAVRAQPNTTGSEPRAGTGDRTALSGGGDPDLPEATSSIRPASSSGCDRRSAGARGVCAYRL